MVEGLVRNGGVAVIGWPDRTGPGLPGTAKRLPRASPPRPIVPRGRAGRGGLARGRRLAVPGSPGPVLSGQPMTATPPFRTSPSTIARYFFHDCERFLYYSSADPKTRKRLGLP